MGSEAMVVCNNSLRLPSLISFCGVSYTHRGALRFPGRFGCLFAFATIKSLLPTNSIVVGYLNFDLNPGR